MKNLTLNKYLNQSLLIVVRKILLVKSTIKWICSNSRTTRNLGIYIFKWVQFNWINGHSISFPAILILSFSAGFKFQSSSNSPKVSPSDSVSFKSFIQLVLDSFKKIVSNLVVAHLLIIVWVFWFGFLKCPLCLVFVCSLFYQLISIINV